MRIRNLILISIIALCIMLAGCGIYQYPQGKEIPVTVGQEEKTNDSAGDAGFKSEFEKLQKLLEEQGNTTNEQAKEEKAVEEVVEAVNETAAAEETPEEVVETPANETENVTITEETPEEVAENVTEDAAEETTKETATEELTVPEGATKITVKEGELINLAIKSDDPEGATIIYTFTKPLDANGKWQTKYGDAGTYKATITASDGELSTSQDVYLIVEKVSRTPVISNFEGITVNEGDTIELKPTVTDPEGGSVTLEYSGWMTAAKKTTTYTDAGEYKVTLKATSSKSDLSAEETITITVKDVNRAPKIISITNK